MFRRKKQPPAFGPARTKSEGNELRKKADELAFWLPGDIEPEIGDRFKGSLKVTRIEDEDGKLNELRIEKRQKNAAGGILTLTITYAPLFDVSLDAHNAGNDGRTNGELGESAIVRHMDLLTALVVPQEVEPYMGVGLEAETPQGPPKLYIVE
jgi:hypothetical protein